jgi:hypothetical protein
LQGLESLAVDFERLSACLAEKQAVAPSSSILIAPLVAATFPLTFSPPSRNGAAPAPAHGDLDAGFGADLPSAGKDDAPCNSPRGERQARQAQQGASRANSGKARSGKAAAWRQDQALKIAITKVPQLETEPSSPKMATQAKVWAKSRRRSKYASGTGHAMDDKSQSPNTFKEKMESKLKLLLGETNVDRSFGTFSSGDSRLHARRATIY